MSQGPGGSFHYKLKGGYGSLVEAWTNPVSVLSRPHRAQTSVTACSSGNKTESPAPVALKTQRDKQNLPLGLSMFKRRPILMICLVKTTSGNITVTLVRL